MSHRRSSNLSRPIEGLQGLEHITNFFQVQKILGNCCRLKRPLECFQRSEELYLGVRRPIESMFGSEGPQIFFWAQKAYRRSSRFRRNIKKYFGLKKLMEGLLDLEDL